MAVVEPASRASAVLLFLVLASSCYAGPVTETDVCVYGGTSGGVVAAVQAARMGKTVALLCGNNHLGGMTAGGLGVTDIGQIGAIGGLTREFYRRVGQHYATAERFYFEPHVAERIFWQMATEARVAVYTNQLIASVTREGTRLQSLRTSAGHEFRARMFIDASYEGDLMSLAGVTFTVGREGTNTYAESLAGARSAGSSYSYDPYVTPGDPASDLLPLLQHGGQPPIGQGDHRVQAFNFRLCLTQNPTNRIPILPPAYYDPADYELLARYLDARLASDGSVSLGQLIHIQQLIPNQKADINANGELSTDFVGASWTWATNTYTGRELIRQAHEDYIRGFLHFLATSPRVPINVRTEMQSWGLAKDEFQDSAGWPHQLYVREARRMISDYVMTQHDCLGKRFASDSVGLASYAMDSHSLTRIASGDRARSEGGFFQAVPQPYPISYRSLIPRSAECDNLAVTFAISASHVAFGSIRMEPVFMILSQSAAAAAALALNNNVALPAVPYDRLVLQLRADGQILDWVGGTLSTNGVIVDNGNPGVAQSGSWTSGANPGYWGTGYVHDQNSGKGSKWVRFTPNLPVTGAYDIYAWWVADPNRATNAPLDVIHASGTNRLLLNQRERGSSWVWLLRTNFVAGQGGGVMIGNEGTTGYVIADAVRFMPVGTFEVPRPVVDLLASDPVAGEFGSNTARITILRSGDLTVPLTISLQTQGTATPGADFQAMPAILTLAPGANATNLWLRMNPETTVEGDESLTISLVPGTNYTLGRCTEATLQLQDKPIDAWRHATFSSLELGDPAVSGNHADADADGLANLQEYAFGMDIRANSAGPVELPHARVEDGQFLLSYWQRKAAEDAPIVPQYSLDLRTWNSGPPWVEIVAVEDAGVRQRITIRRSGLAAPFGFFRLVIAHE